jgi:hypothetical protein
MATLCAGLFAGAAIYISAVEHPARLSCGTELALREFAPSYHRASMTRASWSISSRDLPQKRYSSSAGKDGNSDNT